MATAVDSPALLCAAAEQALLLSDFGSAESQARRCLGSGSKSAVEQERALVVALQALYEQGRASAARQLLADSYPRLDDVPPNPLLLWLALAVDSQHTEEAKQTMPILLSSCQPTEASGWSRAQYLSLLHLYVFEVLLPERRDAAEVARWVENAELPVTQEEQQLLLQELQAHQGAPSSSHAEAAVQGSHVAAAAAATTAPAAAAAVGAPSGPATVVQTTASEAMDGRPASWLPAGQAPVAQQRGGYAATGAATAAAPAGPALRKPQVQQQQREPEIVPAPETQRLAAVGSLGSLSSGDGTPSSTVLAGLEWLCQAQQQAVQTAAALLQPLLGRPPAGKQGSRSALAAAHPSLDPVQLLGGTVLGAVLLYAVYAERQAIRRGARRARQAVAGSAMQLLRMAFSLSINPVATGSPAWR